jgi:hypothetical protein
MKALALVIATSVAFGTTAVAQQTAVPGNGAAQSQTSVSADRSGARAANDSSAQGGFTAERSTGQGGSTRIAGPSEMNATLERSVDARRAKPGDEVTAKTNEAFTMESGMTIPRGTKLMGRVTEARPHARGEGTAESTSQLGLVFDKAVMKDGREVPMRATIQAIAAAESHTQNELGSASHGADAFGASRATSSAGGRLGGALGGLGGGVGAVGGAAGSAGAAAGGASRLPRPAVSGVASGAASAAGRGSAVLGSSSGTVGGLSASGGWLLGSRGAFGLGDLSIASAAASGAQGSVITSASRNVRLDGGTRLLLVGNAGAAGR